MAPTSQSSSTFGPFLHGLAFALIGTINLYLLAELANQKFDADYQRLMSVSFILIFVIFRRYNLIWPWQVGRAGSIGTRVLLSWLLLSSGLLFIGFLTRDIEHFQRRVILLWLITTPLLFVLVHLLVRHFFLHYFPQKLRSRSALLVFINPASQRLAQIFNRMDTPQFDLLGFFEDRSLGRTGAPRHNQPIIGSTEDLVRYVNHHKVEVVFISLPFHGSRRAMQIADQLGDTTASIYYVPDTYIFGLEHIRFSEVGGVPILTLTETPFFGADGVLKRLMDIFFSSLLLICLIPLFLLIVLAIKLTMGSPVFFTQRRYGLDGRQIKVHKFRTMAVSEDDAEICQATRHDPRVLPLGSFLRRTSIDEWPQFWNVLKGEMSLVGPRPHAISHNEQYRKLVKRYMVRHKVKPGLTGLAQVHGLRGDTRDLKKMERRVQYDLDYIQRWSPGLDILIITQTIWIIFRDHEAY